MKFDTKQLLLYAITDRRYLRGRSLGRVVEEALKGGVSMLQLREKELSYEDFIEEALSLKDICASYGVPLIINDRVDVALAAGADGVHVGMEDEAVSSIRKRVGEDFIIGATAKTVEQAKKAESEGANYIGVGAIFPSPTKGSALGITLNDLGVICSSVSLPAVAIGGLNLDNISILEGGPMRGIAVVSAVFGENDVAKAASRLRLRAEELCGLGIGV